MLDLHGSAECSPIAGALEAPQTRSRRLGDPGQPRVPFPRAQRAWHFRTAGTATDPAQASCGLHPASCLAHLAERPARAIGTTRGRSGTPDA